MTLKVVEREDWFTFGKNAGLSGDQMDLIIEQVDDIVKHSEKDFHTLVAVHVLKKAVKDIWSEDDSQKQFFLWLDSLGDYQDVLF